MAFPSKTREDRSVAPLDPPEAPAVLTAEDEDDELDGLDPWAGFTPKERRRGWKILSPEEGRVQFDTAVRRRMGMSGDEFIRRWDAGEYDEIADTEGHRHIMDLAGMIGFARQDR